VMFLDQFSATNHLKRRTLADIFPEINDTRLEFFLKLARTNFQIFDVEEHHEDLRGSVPDPTRGSTPDRRKYRKEQDLG
jgi:hypothetical protein